MAQAAVVPVRVSAFSIFRHRGFTLLWVAQLVSNMGTSLTALAAAIYVYDLTGSALNVGLMLMASAAPSLLVGLVAGVLVDRMDRRRIMLISDVVRAVLVLAIPFLLPFSVAWLYILIFLSSAVGQFFEPAHASVLPEMATEEELTAANSMMAISSFGANIVGYALAGIITGYFAIQWVFYLDALTFLISAGCIYAIRIPRVPVQGKTTVGAVWQNLRSGLQAVAGTPILRSLFLIYMPAFLLVGLHNVLLLPFSIDILQATEAQYGLLESVTIVGFILGSLAMAQYGDRLNEGQWLAISFLGMGVLGVVFALTDSVSWAMILIIVHGLANAPSVVARSLIIQRNTARDMRGRAFSAFFVTRDTVFLTGMALAGLADLFPVRTLLIIANTGFFVAGLVVLVMPGLGQTAAEWRRALSLLRAAPGAPGLGAGRPALLPDFDLLITHQPALALLAPHQRKRLVRQMRVREAPSGAAIMCNGDTSDAAYFILQGRAVAGIERDGEYRILEVMNPGDFFGEIAALTGVPRTANVVAEVDTRLLEVPAATLRQISADPQLNRLILGRMTARMARTNLLDAPRFGGMDQETLLDLRTPQPAAG